jgi:hypothetical protein
MKKKKRRKENVHKVKNQKRNGNEKEIHKEEMKEKNENINYKNEKLIEKQSQRQFIKRRKEKKGRHGKGV